MILRSVNHIVENFGNIATAPKLNFKLGFVDSKCISIPSESEICEKYFWILNLVSIIKYDSIYRTMVMFFGENIKAFKKYY